MTVVSEIMKATYDRLTNDPTLESKLAQSWVVEMYPDDPQIEAKGMVQRMPQSDNVPVIIFGEARWSSSYGSFGQLMWEVYITLVVWDNKPENIKSFEIIDDIERLLKDPLTLTNYSVIKQEAIEGAMRRQDNKTWYAELSYRFELSPR